MNTAENLKEEFKTRFPLLKDVTMKYLGWCPLTTTNKARDGLVPFEYFKLTKSTRSPMLVDVVKLAKYIDQVNQ